MLAKIIGGLGILLGLLGIALTIATWFRPNITDEHKLIITLFLVIAGLVAFVVYLILHSIRREKHGNTVVDVDSEPQFSETVVDVDSEPQFSETVVDVDNEPQFSETVVDVDNEPQFSKRSCDYITHLEQAEQCVFISGTGLAYWGEQKVQEHLIKASEKIPVNIVGSDFFNPNIRKVWKMFTNLKVGELSKILGGRNTLMKERFKKEGEVNYDVVKLFFPVAYFAIDYKSKSKNSFIQIKHYLVNPDYEHFDEYFCTVRPGHILYDIHQKQILWLEKYAKKNSFRGTHKT